MQKNPWLKKISSGEHFFLGDEKMPPIQIDGWTGPRNGTNGFWLII